MLHNTSDSNSKPKKYSVVICLFSAQFQSPRWDLQHDKDSLCPAQMVRKRNTGMAGRALELPGYPCQGPRGRRLICNTSFWEATQALPIKLQNEVSVCMNNPQGLSTALSVLVSQTAPEQLHFIGISFLSSCGGSRILNQIFI